MRSAVQSCVPLQESTANSCVFFVYGLVHPQRGLDIGVNGNLASLKIKKGISSHKKCHFFVRGFQIMDQKRHFEPQTAILAKKWLDSFARIARCFFCGSKNMASSPYHKDDKTKFTNLPFPLIPISRSTLLEPST